MCTLNPVFSIRRIHVFAFFVVCIHACSTSCKTSLSINSSPEPQPKSSTSAYGEHFDNSPVAEPIEQTEFFGVARRLSLRSRPDGIRIPTCQCVIAVVGNGNDDSFEWRDSKPGIGPDALVVAISDDGIPCNHLGRGPSISAISVESGDVVIVIEEFRDARPIVLGAIVPNPGAHGSVYLRAKGRSPYGRPLSGGGELCKIGEGT